MSVTDRVRLQKLLLRLAEELPPAQVQNRLMATTDRDLGLSLMGMAGEDCERLLRLVSSAKAERVRQELALQKTRHIESAHSVTALATTIRSLEANRSVSGQRSYFRPRRPRSEL